jgi:outer membrane protein assembly factor BamB
VALFVAVAASVAAVVPVTAVTTRTPIWSSTFEPWSGASGSAIAVSPSGETVYVGGSVSSSPEDFVIAAYAAGTGQRRWLARYPSGSAPATDCWLGSLVVSTDGGTLFSTGATVANDGSGDWVTMAIDAATGATRWVARVPTLYVWTPSLVMAPAGGRVFVAGSVGTNGRGTRVVSYDAATGEDLWRVRLAGGSGYGAVGVSPGGNRLYVGVVRRQAGLPLNHLAVVGLAARNGSVVWDRSFGEGNRIWEAPYGLAVDPLGERIYVLVWRESSIEGRWPYQLMLAFGATRGRLQWTARVEGIFLSSAADVVASPGRVFVTDGYVVVSHAARTGHPQWGTSTDPLGQNWWAYAAGLALSPDGRRIFVNASFGNSRGTGARLATIGVDSTTGAVRWSAIRRVTHGGGQVVVGPTGARVFVAGSLFGGTDYAPDRGIVTMAYRS